VCRLLIAAGVLALAGCGSHGHSAPPTLRSSTTVTWSKPQAVASAAFSNGLAIAAGRLAVGVSLVGGDHWNFAGGLISGHVGAGLGSVRPLVDPLTAGPVPDRAGTALLTAHAPPLPDAGTVPDPAWAIHFEQRSPEGRLLQRVEMARRAYFYTPTLSVDHVGGVIAASRDGGVVFAWAQSAHAATSDLGGPCTVGAATVSPAGVLHGPARIYNPRLPLSGVPSRDCSPDPPAIAAAPGGGAVVAWNNNGAVRVVDVDARAHLVRSQLLGRQGDHSAMPAVGTDGTGGTVVAWTTIGDGFRLTMDIARRRAGAAHFGPATLLQQRVITAHAGNFDAQAPAIAVARDGRAVLAWTLNTDDSDHSVSPRAALGSVDRGFGPPLALGKNAPLPVAAISDSGAAVLAWGVAKSVASVAAASRSRGFGPVTRIPDPSRRLDVMPTGVAFHGDRPVVLFDVVNQDNPNRIYLASGTSLR
jgi:hypothetical protein